MQCARIEEKSTKITKSNFFHALVDLRVMYTLHPELVRKPVVDMLSVIIEHFCFNNIIQTKICQIQHFLRTWVTMSANIMQKITPPANCCWFQQEALLTLRGQHGGCRNIKGEPQIFRNFPSPRPRPLFLWVWFYGGPWQTQVVYQI